MAYDRARGLLLGDCSQAGRRTDPEAYAAIRSSEEGLIDASGSISMVVNECVVWDFVTPAERTPLPAILNQESLEAAIDRQGYRPWALKTG